MNYVFKFFLVFIIHSLLVLAQVQPGYSSSIFVSDGEVIPRKLTFGLDTQATDGIDTLFGESDLPPFPPPGAFDARLNLPADNFSGVLSSWIDIRQATFPFTGQKEFRVRYQPGLGSIIRISWAFPPEITGRLQDVVLGSLIDVNMTGQDSFEVANPISFDRLKMTINFNNVVSGIEEVNIIPTSYSLQQNYPNPFNPSTKISYVLPESGNIRLSVYNLLGQEIAILYEGYHNAGKYSKFFDASGLSSGIYIYKLETSKLSLVNKMTLLK